MEAHGARLLLALRATLLCIEMVMTRNAGDNFALAGNAEALCVGFIRLHEVFLSQQKPA